MSSDVVKVPRSLVIEAVDVLAEYGNGAGLRDDLIGCLRAQDDLGDWIPVSIPPTKNGRCIVVVTWPSGRSTVTTCIYLVQHGFMGVMGDVVFWQPYPEIPGVTVQAVQHE
jgi:hypothetical protein